MADDTRRRFHQAFSPEPLRPEDIRSLYVDLDAVRGDQGVVPGLRETITVDDGPTCQLLAGHKGSGKSTELARLRRELEEQHSCFVVQFVAEDELDLNDVDAPDLLLAIARVLITHAAKRLHLDLGTSLLSNVVNRILGGLKTHLAVHAASLGLGPLSLSLALRSSPDFRKQVRQQAEPEVRELVNAINDLIGEITQHLAKPQSVYRRLVLIIDDLDKLSTRARAEVGFGHAEYLFLVREPQLTSLACDVIYTVPLDLAYSPKGQQLAALYGCALPVVPMVRVSDQKGDGQPDPVAATGRQLLRRLVQLRLDHIGLSLDSAFAPGQLDALIELSGGQPDVLMRTIRQAALKGGLPIGRDDVERVTIEERRGLLRGLMAEHTPLLEEVRASGQMTRSDTNERWWRELLTSRAVLLYMNDAEWFALNPALSGTALPKPLDPLA